MSATVAPRLLSMDVDALQAEVRGLGALVRDATRDATLLDALRRRLDAIDLLARGVGAHGVSQAAQTALGAEDARLREDSIGRLIDVCQKLTGVAPLFRPLLLLADLAIGDAALPGDVRRVTDVEAAIAALGDTDPGAFIVDVRHLDALKRSVPAHRANVPFIVVGPDDDLDLRVAAARHGVEAYLPDDTSLQRTVTLARALTTDKEPPPFRVLMVEPDWDAAHQGIRAIEAPDRMVRWLQDGTALVSAMEEFWPELVIVSIPPEDGHVARAVAGSTRPADLVGVVRTHATLGHTPVLLIGDPSTAGARDVQGIADGLVARSVDVDDLKRRIQGLVERCRRHRRQLVVDPLTGVMGRGAWLEAADRTLAMCHRAGAGGCVGLVGLSGTRQINERHGWMVGDRAIAGVAKVLQQVMAGSALLGRVSGDGFGLLLPGRTVEEGVAELEAARDRFVGWAQGAQLEDLRLAIGLSDAGEIGRGALHLADQALLGARRDLASDVRVAETEAPAAH